MVYCIWYGYGFGVGAAPNYRVPAVRFLGFRSCVLAAACKTRRIKTSTLMSNTNAVIAARCGRGRCSFAGCFGFPL